MDNLNQLPVGKGKQNNTYFEEKVIDIELCRAGRAGKKTY
jgi:hypothetical protein